MSTALVNREKPLVPARQRCPRCGAQAVAGALLCGCRARYINVSQEDFDKTQAEKAAITGLSPEQIARGLDHYTRVNKESSDPLKRKQAYYIYGERPYRFKEAPALDRDLVNALKHEQLDKTYRFVWGGVVLVREEENSDSYVIARGDKTAIADYNGLMMPKYIFARARQAKGYCYFNDLNQKVDVTRQELVPPGRVCRVDYRYVDFGMLKWFLEQRIPATELITARVYDPHEKVPEHEWTCIMPLATKAGLYYEPGLEMIEILKQREWENRNADLNAVALTNIERQLKASEESENAQDVADKKEFDLLFADVMARHETQTAYKFAE